MEQIINQAAKWNYMTAGKQKVPLVIRMIVGKGWGQGPQHSQSLESLFGHIPGLKVVIPSNPRDAKDLLISSIFDPNPVIFIEHRWLHEMVGKINYKTEIKKLEKIPMPIELEVLYNDNSRKTMYIPLSIMRGEKSFKSEEDVIIMPDWEWVNDSYTIELDIKGKLIKSITIDPKKQLADYNRANNFLKID